MPVYTVDSEAVFTATANVRSTMERVRAEHQTLMSQLTQLQSVWTGGASAAFGSVAEQWRGSSLAVEESLASIGMALEAAGRGYADTEQATTNMFRY